MISRRQLLQCLLSGLLLPGTTLAANGGRGHISWQSFQEQMHKLAELHSLGLIEQGELSMRGMGILQRLDTVSPDYTQAVAQSFESGNRYWLWQRLLKSRNLNGGILNIEQKQMVQLHDHPGATGMVRILSGEVEVWQFDEAGSANNDEGVVELVLAGRRLLRPGDMAILSPHRGNIHALRAISDECRMLDFFIPPYRRSERHWFEPLSDSWFDLKKVACRKIPQEIYTKA